ncbi:MAG: DUF58 domain-containing protein [Acidobacteria bacterium]|nr:DUF58 domain-containing protein [Acidobacteriota bacterium]
MAWNQRVTPAGWAFAAAILLVGLAAFASANNLLFLLLAAMLAALLISGLVGRLSLAALEIEYLVPEHISARRQFTGRLLVRNTKKWMTSFSILLEGSPQSGLTAPLYLAAIPGGATLNEPVELLFARRGAHTENSFRFSTRFPFGFTERGVRVNLRREVLVYPCLDPRPGFEELASFLSGEVETHYRGRGHDFYRIRPYEPMESARHVDWKATAHTGALQVREFAREQEHLIYLYFDLDGAAGPEWFEHAVDCAAYLSWRVVQQGARLRFRTQECDLVVPEEGDIYRILKYLALVKPLSGREPAPSDDEVGFQVVLTARPDWMLELGWVGARLLTPETLSRES